MIQRGKSRTGKRYNFNNKETYKLFIEKHKKYKIDFKIFQQTLNKITELVGESITSNSMGIKLNDLLGYLVVTECANHKEIPDHTKLATTGKIRKFLNIHTDGKRYALKWIPTNSQNLDFAYCYRFSGARKVTRRVKPNLIEGKKYYSLNDKDMVNTRKYWRKKIEEEYV